MKRMTRLLAGLLGTTARVLPPARRQWAEAIQAEAGQIPAGWRQLHWLAGGVWLVAREANMARKIVYWLGLGVVAVAAAWAIWLSWRTVPTADPESVTDRVRILVGASALLVLPWAGRRSGLFGPAGSGITPRLVRVAGCAAICGLGVSIVRVDRNAGAGGVLGSGAISWPREIAGLAVLGAIAAMPPVIRTLRPRADAGAVWRPTALAAAVAFAVMPLQMLTILYVAGILAATSRRSPVPSATLAIGTIAGLATGLIIYGVQAIPLDLDLSGAVVLTYFLILAVITFLAAATAGIASASLRPGLADPRELRVRRVRQGLLAGVIAGAAGGLLITAIFGGLGFMMIIGPLAGAGGGALGGAIAAAHPRKSLSGGSWAAGMFVAGP
jgi:hypothetical protein